VYRYHGRPARFFRCAYQANVMKTFEAMSSKVAEMTGFTDQVLKQSTPRSRRAVSVLW
jgi:hypothetical protein